MFLGRAVDHRIEEESSGGEINNGSACDAEWVDVSARQTRGDWRAKIPLPNHSATKGVERINIIRLGHYNDHSPAIGAALDVQRLCVNIARNRAIEVQVASHTCRGRRCECRIDVKAIARKIILLLSNIDLSVYRKNRTPTNKKK
jgi:hypothetical protein